MIGILSAIDQYKFCGEVCQIGESPYCYSRVPSSNLHTTVGFVHSFDYLTLVSFLSKGETIKYWITTKLWQLSHHVPTGRCSLKRDPFSAYHGDTHQCLFFRWLLFPITVLVNYRSHQLTSQSNLFFKWRKRKGWICLDLAYPKFL